MGCRCLTADDSKPLLQFSVGVNGVEASRQTGFGGGTSLHLLLSPYMIKKTKQGSDNNKRINLCVEIINTTLLHTAYCLVLDIYKFCILYLYIIKV